MDSDTSSNDDNCDCEENGEYEHTCGKRYYTAPQDAPGPHYLSSDSFENEKRNRGNLQPYEQTKSVNICSHSFLQTVQLNLLHLKNQEKENQETSETKIKQGKEYSLNCRIKLVV